MTHMVASEALTPSEPPWGSLSGEGLILVLPTKGMCSLYLIWWTEIIRTGYPPRPEGKPQLSEVIRSDCNYIVPELS